MNNLKALNGRLEAIAWGIILILLSILMVVPGDQGNEFVLGTGVVFLGLNLARSMMGIPLNWFSITLGGLALLLGGLGVLWPVLGIKAHVKVDIFPLILLAIGLYLLIPAPKQQTSG